MNENKKNNSILVFIIGFVVGLVVMFAFTFFTKEKCEVCEKCDNNTEEKTDELSKTEKEMFDLLNGVAKEVYSKNQYTNLNKNEQGVYYATLLDLSNLNYDVSSLSHCDQKNAMVFFDVDKKMSQSYEKEPIQISVSCNLGTKIEE